MSGWPDEHLGSMVSKRKHSGVWVRRRTGISGEFATVCSPSVPSPENYFLSVSFVPVTTYTGVWGWKEPSCKSQVGSSDVT